jgi:hypothetical protein
MHRKELNERSPLRVLDQSIHGGLGRGNLGVVVARHGVGKTAFLVGVALDDLMRGRKVLHVAVGEPMEKVEAYYDEIFIDLAHTQRLEDQWTARMDAERNRRIQCFPGYAFNLEKLRETLAFWKKVNEFAPTAIVIEGFDFASASEQQLAELREVAGSVDAEVWMSATTTRDAERNERGVPEPLAHLEGSVDVILSMAHDGKAVHVGLHKDHDNPKVSDLKLALDPRTMLLIKE